MQCDKILRLVRENNFYLHKCIAQCNDRASVMSGLFSGAQKRVAEVIPHAIYLINTIQDVKPVVDFFDSIKDFINIYEWSYQVRVIYKYSREKKTIKVLHLERLVESSWSY